MSATINFDRGIRFTLTDNVMDTIIEDTSNVVMPRMIVLNNLAICSLAERGLEFCKLANNYDDKMCPLEAPIFQLRARFYPNNMMVLIQNNMEITLPYDYIYQYYTQILCNIMIDKNMEDATGFEDNNLKEVKTLKEDYERKKSKH